MNRLLPYIMNGFITYYKFSCLDPKIYWSVSIQPSNDLILVVVDVTMDINERIKLQ
jgi:hypothetical protein